MKLEYATTDNSKQGLARFAPLDQDRVKGENIFYKNEIARGDGYSALLALLIGKKDSYKQYGPI